MYPKEAKELLDLIEKYGRLCEIRELCRISNIESTYYRYYTQKRDDTLSRIKDYLIPDTETIDEQVTESSARIKELNNRFMGDDGGCNCPMCLSMRGARL